MATLLPITVDLTGLPEPTVRAVQRLVDAVRADGDAFTVTESGIWPVTPPVTCSRLSHEEFSKLLDEMAAMSSGQALPVNFSQADIYDDHD